PEFQVPQSPRQILNIPTELQSIEEEYQIVVTELLMLETGTYNDMYARPYQSHTNDAKLNILAEATRGGQALQPSSLSGVAGLFLQPSAEVDRSSPIITPNGYGSKRFRFLMKVEYTNAMGLRHTLAYSGYTD